MITRVQAKNFKSFREIDVELGPLTVFVGRNASGKSNFVDILRFVRDAVTNGLESAINIRGGYGGIAFQDDTSTARSIEISITLRSEGWNAIYKIQIGPSQDYDFVVLLEDADMSVIGDIRDSDRDGHFGFAIEQGSVIRKEILPMSGSLFSQGANVNTDGLHLPGLAILDAQMNLLCSWLTQIDCFHFFPNTFRPLRASSGRLVMGDQGEGINTRPSTDIGRPADTR